MAICCSWKRFYGSDKKDSSLWLWGVNYFGQIGKGTHGDSTDQIIPLQIQPGTKWIYVSTGECHI
ncbi:MAG: hypothetical protein IPP15_13160 [Saprospiraceae bacterium]|uniref:Uncharacterized protein n=1 Tax=Candidatus Opimibacter skivensis TaxID=2982028 RepID=A0A9D7SWA1_9BACT|nr:hypothetical protein [Candidatus Opimibacter skivensis]